MGSATVSVASVGVSPTDPARSIFAITAAPEPQPRSLDCGGMTPLWLHATNFLQALGSLDDEGKALSWRQLKRNEPVIHT
jgi:hypothetical protein